ncbi:MAG: serine/threonine protein kinase [Anaerolineae bacterium]|nr:serine/threonine protein kinase [Gemmatimonadaceae bacterium]
MHKRRLIVPPPPSTPADLATSRGDRCVIPPDLLRDASRRLGIMALVGAALWVSGTVLGHIVDRAIISGNSDWLTLTATDAIAAAGGIVSLALFAYTRRTRREPAFVLDLGLVYLVLTALDLGLLFHFTAGARPVDVLPEISWIGAVVLMYAAIVPTAPAKMLVTGVIAVSMNPVSMLIAKATGNWEFGSASNVLLMHYPDYLLVGVAAVISHVVTRLGQQVTKAREMGSYQVGELLGRGGMGEVYKATHRMLARPAAIKLIRSEAFAGPNGEVAKLAVRRFRREAEVAANLRSPHTVELYDFGVTEDQTLYFVMELLDGLDLESLVQRHGPVGPSRVIHILKQVCESLEEAHVAGMVHRDIKPANIHVGRLGLEQDFVKVLDFGLVKPASATSVSSLGTEAGLTPGTPSYMAPEMALGEAVDGRADIYALGCVAYYLLTGQLVFEAEYGFQVIAKHMMDEPEPPSQRSGIHIPLALEQLVLDCLAKKPADRPRSAAELGRSLAALDVATWSQEQAMQWWDANRDPAIDSNPLVQSGLEALSPRA